MGKIEFKTRNGERIAIFAGLLLWVALCIGIPTKIEMDKRRSYQDIKPDKVSSQNK